MPATKTASATRATLDAYYIARAERTGVAVPALNPTTGELPSDNTLRFAPGARVHQKRNTRIYGYVREIRPHAAKGTSYAIWWSNTCSVGDGWCDHDLA